MLFPPDDDEVLVVVVLPPEFPEKFPVPPPVIIPVVDFAAAVIRCYDDLTLTVLPLFFGPWQTTIRIDPSGFKVFMKKRTASIPWAQFISSLLVNTVLFERRAHLGPFLQCVS